MTGFVCSAKGSSVDLTATSHFVNVTVKYDGNKKNVDRNSHNHCEDSEFRVEGTTISHCNLHNKMFLMGTIRPHLPTR